MTKNSNSYGFSIIEVMISIFIFSMGMASIFMLISSSININATNKDSIIASNLAREGIEIIRNIRDYNYETYHNYNWIPNPSNDFTKKLELWVYYKLENDFSSPNYSFSLKSDWNQFFTSDPQDDFKNWKFDDYVLCIKKDTSIYSHDCLDEDKKTNIHRYVVLSELKDSSWNVIDGAFKLKSKVVWYSKKYREFEINTILTNFNRY